MAPLFSVTKFLSKARSKAKKGGEASRAASFVGEERDPGRTPLAGSSTSQIIVVDPPPPLPAQAKLLSPPLRERTENETVSTSASEYFNAGETLEKKDEGKDRSLDGGGYANVQQPDAKSSEIEWTELEAVQSEEKENNRVAEAATIEVVDDRTEDDRGGQSYMAQLEDAVEEKNRIQVEVQGMEAELVQVRQERDTTQQEKENLQQRAESYKEELRIVSKAKEMLEERLHNAEDELRKALAANRAKSHDLGMLEVQVEGLKVETEALRREKDQVQRVMEGEKAILRQNVEREKEEIRQKAEEERTRIRKQFAREKEDVSRAATQEKESFTKEVQRLQGLIATEMQRSQEKAKSFVGEKDELVTKLEAQQDRIAGLVTKLEVQQERISGLEARLEDSREETRELYTKHEELQAMVKRYEHDISEEHDREETKENHIEMLEMNNASMTSQLVQLQEKVNETERRNDMLMDQVRQQADQLQGRNSEAGRFNTASLSGIAKGLRRGACGARAEGAVKALKLLNDEIYQVAASLTDQLEDKNKRFVAGDNGRSAKAEYLKSILGLELAKRLERDAPHPMEDTSAFFIQVALQGCLTACCTRIITSWYPTEWEYGSFLEALFERVRGSSEFIPDFSSFVC